MRVSQCHEDWNKMIPNETGKHCQTCNLTVLNLKNKSLQEIEAQKEEKGKICGRVTKVQLSEFQYLHPLKRFAIALFLVFGTSLFTASYGQIMEETALVKQTENTFIIKFKAEKTDGTPLKGVYINFDTQDDYQEGSTNEKGELTLDFSSDAKEIEVYVNISFDNIFATVHFSASHEWINNFDKIIYNPENYTLTIGDQEFYEEIIMGDIAPIEWEEDPFEQKTENN